jgi:hypothetical protein
VKEGVVRYAGLKKAEDHVQIFVSQGETTLALRFQPADVTVLHGELTKILPLSAEGRAWEAFLELSKSLTDAQVKKILFSGLLTPLQITSLTKVLKIASGKP